MVDNVLLVTSGVLTGLMAGLLYAFQVAVVPGLRASTGTQHIAVMQAISERITNPVFFLSFFGPTLLLPLTAWLFRDRPQFPLLVAAALLHILGANGVTIAGNIPLNERLAKVNVEVLNEAEADRIRQDFHELGSPWMRFHWIRTLASVAAAALVLIACLSRETAS
jgi:uncharacterized membrane protein